VSGHYKNMAREIIQKKLAQMKNLLADLDRLLKMPFDVFVGDIDSVRAAERNFELLIELSSDINNEIALEKNLPIADTYRGSFTKLSGAGVLSGELSEKLGEATRLRNILVHEYDFEEDYRMFYDSATEMLPAFREYADAIGGYAAGMTVGER
jgi:uncharacterized protein YutE (UPF0331/DUF86 family)